MHGWFVCVIRVPVCAPLPRVCPVCVPAPPGVFEPVRMYPGSHGIFLPVLNRSGSPLSFYR